MASVKHPSGDCSSMTSQPRRLPSVTKEASNALAASSRSPRRTTCSASSSAWLQASSSISVAAMSLPSLVRATAKSSASASREHHATTSSAAMPPAPRRWNTFSARNFAGKLAAATLKSSTASGCNVAACFLGRCVESHRLSLTTACDSRKVSRKRLFCASFVITHASLTASGKLCVNSSPPFHSAKAWTAPSSSGALGRSACGRTAINACTNDTAAADGANFDASAGASSAVVEAIGVDPWATKASHRTCRCSGHISAWPGLATAPSSM
mmetsp:Transcript_80686/g.159846  ORF Transcript_80686/g.159846 Transcript_80686/m.159846 type:complete len:270 (+) Transcript_80686:370-1179(+)